MPSTNQSPTATGRQDDFIERWRRQVAPKVGTGRHLLVIAQPKSGSTALCNILSELTGMPVSRYADRSVHGYSFSVQQAISIANRDHVIHLHSLPSWPLQVWMEERRLVPTILVRDIGESLVSMYHHLRRGFADTGELLRHLPYERGMEQVAYQWAHWYIHFQKSWRQYIDIGKPGVFLESTELFADPAAVACRVLEANGLPASREAAEQAAHRVLSDAMRSNYHGSSGELPASVRDAVERLSADYEVLRGMAAE